MSSMTKRLPRECWEDTLLWGNMQSLEQGQEQEQEVQEQEQERRQEQKQETHSPISVTPPFRGYLFNIAIKTRRGRPC